MLAPIRQSDKDCYGEKAILVMQGNTSPYPRTPELLPVSIHTIGQLSMLWFLQNLPSWQDVVLWLR
jgi:hypothetical protein